MKSVNFIIKELSSILEVASFYIFNLSSSIILFIMRSVNSIIKELSSILEVASFYIFNLSSSIILFIMRSDKFTFLLN